MGAALSSRAVWVSAATDAKGKLDFSRSNEDLLKDIVYHIEELVQNNPREAEVIFQKPLAWESPSPLSVFESLGHPDFVKR